MIFLPKSAKLEIPEAGLEILYRQIERFIRAGGILSLSDYKLLDDVEIEAFVQARRVIDFERALLQNRIAQGVSPEDLLRVVDPPAAAKLALDGALKAMAAKMNTATFAREAKP
jgi:hypothetical protein